MTPIHLLCILVLLLLTTAHAHDLPDIAQVFDEIVKKNREHKIAAEENAVHSRVKRQGSEIGDESQDPWESKASSLPTKQDGVTINDRYMPTLSNGHMGVTVYDGALYVNGLYNGAGGDSHRALVPALVMSRINLTDPNGDEINDIERKAVRKFHLNAKEGYFMEYIECEFAYIWHRIYVHQKYVRLLVSDIYAERRENIQGGGILYLKYPEEDDTDDINFGQRETHYSNWRVVGQTKEAEDNVSPASISVYWMTTVEQIPFRGSSTTLNETIVMSVDKVDSLARAEFDKAIAILEDADGHGHYTLLREHVEAWQHTWDQGRVEVEGDLTVAKVTNFAQYYLYSNMLAIDPYQPPQHSQIYYGVGRNTLAKGGLGKDYQGHVFWDSEAYILPALVMFFPENVKKMMRYRTFTSHRAEAHAKAMGAEGFRYPWEGGFSGNDVTPDTCMECRDNQLHVSAAISWMIRIFYSATRDRDYMTNPDYNGCDITREIARFYNSLMVKNETKERWEIKGVMGPDDWRPKVDNNAYTNVAAALAIHWARYFACMCNRNDREEVPDEWVQAALYLYVPYDNIKRVHYQYEGFEKDRETNQTRIKQADALLLGYHLNWNMSTDILRNDLEYYETLLSDDSPAMTWSYYTMGWKHIGDQGKINSYFLKSYQDYMVNPFKVWTEFNERSWQDQEEGTVNFLPGMGGFVQSLLFGFGGIRIRPQFLEFHNPVPPPNCNKMTFYQFKYLEAVMDVVIDASPPRVTIKVYKTGSEYPLHVYKNETDEEIPIVTDEEIIIDSPEYGFYIFSKHSTACLHPRDYIYMPYGDDPWGRASQSTLVSIPLLLVLLCLATFRPLMLTSPWTMVTSFVTWREH